MSWAKHDYEDIPGTYVFDGQHAHGAYPLNTLLFSLNQAANRDSFAKDPAAYCDRHGVAGRYKELVLEKDVLGMLRAGANIYYLAKMAVPCGTSVQAAVESYAEDLSVVIFGTGGLSHQLQGERAGLIDVEFDLDCMEKIANDPLWMTRFSNAEIMRRAGTEGIETIMWLVMRGALEADVKVVHKHYHAPISNTGAGVLVLENYLSR